MALQPMFTLLAYYFLCTVAQGDGLWMQRQALDRHSLRQSDSLVIHEYSVGTGTSRLLSVYLVPHHRRRIYVNIPRNVHLSIHNLGLLSEQCGVAPPTATARTGSQRGHYSQLQKSSLEPTYYQLQPTISLDLDTFEGSQGSLEIVKRLRCLSIVYARCFIHHVSFHGA